MVFRVFVLNGVSISSLCLKPRVSLHFKFQALLDTGAAAVSARIWREYLIAFYPNLNPSARGVVTTVDGCELVTLETLVLTFDINADSFPAKAHVIEGLVFDVLIGRDFQSGEVALESIS